MNAKNETPESPYVVDEVRTTPWIKSKAGKLTAVIAGGVVALGASFGAGVAVGSHGNPLSRGDFGGQGFDRDGDHNFPGGQLPNGQHPIRPGGGDGDHGGDQNFQVPAPGQTPPTQNG